VSATEVNTRKILDGLVDPFLQILLDHPKHVYHSTDASAYGFSYWYASSMAFKAQFNVTLTELTLSTKLI